MVDNKTFRTIVFQIKPINGNAYRPYDISYIKETNALWGLYMDKFINGI